jgi:hypothetical protein
VTQSTIDARQIGAGKARPSRIDQLCDVTTAFLVEKVPNTRTVRLFYEKFDSASVNGSKGKGVVPSKAAKARLALLAKGMSRVPEIVRRCRLGFQKLADRSVFAAKNPRCTYCTKSLHFLTKKKRFYLCVYYVCDRCLTRQKMETYYNNKLASILICTRCLERVDSCEYREISSQKWRIVCVEPDDEGPSNTDAASRGKAIVNIMGNALDDSDRVINEAATFLIKHILDQSKHSESGRTACDNTHRLSALEKSFQFDPLLPLETCVLANAESRNYPIHMPEKPSITVPDFPVPRDEAKRLRAINEDQFLKLGDIAELNIICTLAFIELECAISQVTIADEESEFILACSVKDLHCIRMTHNQTFCSHLIMDDKPLLLLLLNPEVNVRFCRLDAVAKIGIRFYCVFPITAKVSTIVGSLCCLDFQ